MAQPSIWNVRSVSMADGLPANTVRSIVQDKDGFMWFGTDNGLCRYDGYEVRRYVNPVLGLDQFVSTLTVFDDRLLVGTSHGAFFFDVNTGHFSLLDRRLTSQVNNFAVDADGNVWIATSGAGLYCYHPNMKFCKRFAMTQAKGDIAFVFVDSDNQIWALTRHGRGFYHYNKAHKSFDAVTLKGLAANMEGMAMAQGLNGSLLIGTWNNGLIALHQDGQVEQLLKPSVDGVGNHIHTVFNDASGVVYIGCDDGLVRYDLRQKTYTMKTRLVNASASEKFVYAIARDREDGLWMGTYYGGVTYFSPMGQRFVSFHADDSLFRGNVVSRFCEDDSHCVWIATDDGGLNCYDMNVGKFVTFPGMQTYRELNTHGLWAEGNSLWVGTYGNGLWRINTATGVAKVYELDGQHSKSNCYCVMRDSRGRLWAASMININVYNHEDDAFHIAKRFKSLTIDIEEDHRGNVWFATQGGGLWKLSKNGKWKLYRHSSDTTSICSNTINGIREDAGGHLFIATSEGLCEYLPNRDYFQRINVESESRNFTGIVINNDEIWLTSEKGLIRYVPNGKTQMFNRSDGLIDGPFQPNACMMASDGRVWLGSVNGINAFYPYQIKPNKNEPPVFITGMEIPGVDEAATDSLSGILSHAKSVSLEYNENMFFIHFAALSYVSPEKNRYMYKLEGFDEDWIESGADHRAAFTNIPPGTYTFLVKACNNDGVWSAKPASLKITIHPPFYWSLPAKLFYLLVLIALVWYFVHITLLKAERRHQQELKAAGERKEKELREAQLHFFTMIAHEIRTPVTLIIGPLENLKERWLKASKQRRISDVATQTLDVIDRNAHRLLDLVNQLLDYNKVKQQGMCMNFGICNIAKIMQAVAVRFEPTFKQNGINFTVDYPDKSFTAMVDDEAVTKILSNFMTNAGKYTRTRIRMSCIVMENGMFRLEVEDDGLGIDKDEQKRIFDAFYQAKDNKAGTGIGLSTVKLLAEAHHGMVEVVSDVGAGSLFSVTLPIKQDVALEIHTDETLTANNDSVVDDLTDEEDENVNQYGKKATILVVEDDDDMRNFIAANFKSSYEVLTAGDGEEAIEKLKTNGAGIIVSDWMMPKMDGAELCKKVRSNPETSHILFIMLTAKTDDESKTEGMNIGADAYIEKPFSIKYLEACIRNLLSRRKLLMERFANSPSEPISHIADNPVDNELLTRMNEIILENINKPELNVGFIASQLHLSRSGLFAKIKSLTDVTPNEMIQVVRLRRAAQLLSEGKHSVSEVAFLVGFNSSSYFAKCFYRQFGVRPSEFHATT